MLEESLAEFPGAIVLVTHDRRMLDGVCTEILGLDGNGLVGRYVDCAQWQAARASLGGRKRENVAKVKAKEPRRKADRKRLTASETKELQNMEETIQEAEECVEQCRRALDDPEVAGDHVEAQKRWEQLEVARKHVEALYVRWQELEVKAR